MRHCSSWVSLFFLEALPHSWCKLSPPNTRKQLRLARILLLLAHFGKEGKPETVIPKMSQETLADNDRHNAIAGKFFHEQVQEIGVH